MQRYVQAAMAGACWLGLATAATAQTAGVTPLPMGNSLESSAVQADHWVVDVGACETAPCIYTSPPAVDLLAVTHTFAQVDWSEGFLNPASNVAAPWNLSLYSGISFYFEDLNAANASGYSQYDHYFLIYDSNDCYREWVINNVTATGASISGDQQLVPGTWYEITGSFNAPQGQNVIQGGTPKNGVACKSQPLDLAQVTYFEVGVFYGPMAVGDGVTYHVRVGGVAPVSLP